MKLRPKTESEPKRVLRESFQFTKSILSGLDIDCLADIPKNGFCVSKRTFSARIFLRDCRKCIFFGLRAKISWLMLSKVHSTCSEEHFGEIFLKSDYVHAKLAKEWRKNIYNLREDFPSVIYITTGSNKTFGYHRDIFRLPNL